MGFGQARLVILSRPWALARRADSFYTMAIHARLHALLEDLNISTAYSPQALSLAQSLAQNPGIDDARLVDRCDLAFCTIDEPTSKDLDQALFVEAIDGGGHRVWYAIADAAHFVQPQSVLWDEAMRRGSSYYLPGQVIPMLPRVLSEGVMSLNPEVERRALLFVVELDDAGKVAQSRIERARIRSRAKLSYQGVQAWYDGKGPAHCDEQVQASLRALAVVGKRRVALALERGVVPFRRREVELAAAEQAGHFVAYEDVRRDVERFNEQLSLLCNVQGARFLQAPGQEVHPIYRVHPSPDPERREQLRRRVETLVKHRGLDPQTWSWDGREETFADWLGALPSSGAQAEIAEVIHRQAVVSSGRAAFAATPGEHHGVGADVYGRFTAPMREMVGVYLHGEACERLGTNTQGSPKGQDAQRLRDRVIEAAEQARNHQKALDRAVNRAVLDQVLTADIQGGGKARAGVLMGMSRRKLYVRLVQPPFDVKVYLHHIEAQLGHRLRVDAQGVQLFGGDQPLLLLGDRVTLRAVKQDPDADRWVFHLSWEQSP